MENDSATIQRILDTCRIIAVVGFSSKTYRAGYTVPAYLQRQGYRIIPVNPHLQQALGEKAYPDLLSIPEPVDLVLIFRQPQYVPELVQQAVQIGARAVWMQQGIRHAETAATARAHGLQDGGASPALRGYRRSAGANALAGGRRNGRALCCYCRGLATHGRDGGSLLRVLSEQTESAISVAFSHCLTNLSSTLPAWLPLPCPALRHAIQDHGHDHDGNTGLHSATGLILGEANHRFQA